MSESNFKILTAAQNCVLSAAYCVVVVVAYSAFHTVPGNLQSRRRYETVVIVILVWSKLIIPVGAKFGIAAFLAANCVLMYASKFTAMPLTLSKFISRSSFLKNMVTSFATVPVKPAGYCLKRKHWFSCFCSPVINNIVNLGKRLEKNVHECRLHGCIARTNVGLHPNRFELRVAFKVLL